MADLASIEQALRNATAAADDPNLPQEDRDAAAFDAKQLALAYRNAQEEPEPELGLEPPPLEQEPEPPMLPETAALTQEMLNQSLQVPEEVPEEESDFSNVTGGTGTTYPQESKINRFLTGGIRNVQSDLEAASKEGGIKGTLANYLMPHAKAYGGAIESLAGGVRGVRQLLPQSPAEEAVLEAEEQAARDQIEKGGNWAKYGSGVGELGQWMLPAAKVAKLAKGSRTALAIGEAGLGYLQGYSQPVVGDESRESRAKIGAIFGGLLPGAGVVTKKLGDIVERVPYIGAPTRAVRGREVIREATESKERLAAQNVKRQTEERHRKAVEAVEKHNRNVEAQQFKETAATAKANFELDKKKQLGKVAKRLEKSVQAIPKVAITPAAANRLRAIQRSGVGLPESYAGLVDQVELAAKTGYMRGKMADTIKHQLGAEARASKGAGKQQLHEAERIITDALIKAAPTKRKGKALEKIYTRYGEIYHAKPNIPTALPLQPKAKPTLVLPPEATYKPPADLPKGLLKTSAGRAFARSLGIEAMLRRQQDQDDEYEYEE